MDYRTYQQIRTYCTHDLRAYLGLPGDEEETMRLFYANLHGQLGILLREIELAHSFHQCDGLTPRERAASELLAVVSNLRIYTWLREPKPPDGRERLPQPTKVVADAQKKQMLDAVKRYAAFLPEPERDVLLEDCKAALEAAPTAAPAAKVGAGAGTTPGDDWKEKARAITDRLALEKHQRGEREITARNTCDAAAIELAKDSTTHGIRGPRVAGSIRNEALKGWKFIPPTGTNGTSGTKK